MKSGFLDLIVGYRRTKRRHAPVTQVGRQGRTPAWQGVTALTDPDGYGITLTDGTVSVRLLFHNQVAIQTPSSRALIGFRKRLADIDSGAAGRC